MYVGRGGGGRGLSANAVDSESAARSVRVPSALNSVSAGKKLPPGHRLIRRLQSVVSSWGAGSPSHPLAMRAYSAFHARHPARSFRIDGCGFAATHAAARSARSCLTPQAEFYREPDVSEQEYALRIGYG